MDHDAMGGSLSLQDALEASPGDLRLRVARSGVCVIRGDRVDVAAFGRILCRLGTPAPHPLQRFRATEDPRMLIVSNLVNDGQPYGIRDGGAYWHTDMSYRAQNRIFTGLYCVNPAPHGGETSFVDCRKGWLRIREALDDGRLSIGMSADDLRSMVAQHRFGNRDTARDRGAATQVLDKKEAATLDPAVTHPLIQAHPLTGSEYIYAPAATSFGFVGHEEGESVWILDRLLHTMLDGDRVYRHAYRKGDIVVWDNLTTLHRGPDLAATSSSAQARILYRLSVDYAD